MRKVFPAPIRASAVVLLAAGLAACAGHKQPPMPNYQPEAFDGKAYVREFAADAARTCEAARRALLSQGYLISTGQGGEQVLGRKHFQPSADHHVQLEFSVVCTAAAGSAAKAATAARRAKAKKAAARKASMAFVSVLKDQYVVRKTRESTSVRLGGLGAVSVPVEGNMDSLGKVASETVSDPALYERFFQLVDSYLTGAPVPAPMQASASASTAAGQQGSSAQKNAAAQGSNGYQDTTWLTDDEDAAFRQQETRISKKRASTRKKSRRWRKY